MKRNIMHEYLMDDTHLTKLKKENIKYGKAQSLSSSILIRRTHKKMVAKTRQNKTKHSIFRVNKT